VVLVHIVPGRCPKMIEVNKRISNPDFILKNVCVLYAFERSEALKCLLMINYGSNKFNNLLGLFGFY
jgi:hypothetical protein